MTDVQYGLTNPAVAKAPSPLFDLTGRTALITGSSRGIGLALATGLAAAGARVVLNGIRPDPLDRARAALAERFGDQAMAARAFDVTDPDAVADGITWIEATVDHSTS